VIAMLQFMLLSAPRSASTWASAWLTTDTTLCLHDPLWRWHYTELDAIKSDKLLGIACTGVALFPDWVNAHPARKIILHRPLDEVDASLVKIGLTPCSAQWEGVLEKIRGVHLDWRDLFERPKDIYEYLLDRSFDAERHATLREMNIQPCFAALSIDRGATSRLIRELECARAH
jgi:hypothetical protein